MQEPGEDLFVPYADSTATVPITAEYLGPSGGRCCQLPHSVPSEPPNGLAASYYYCTVSGMSTSAPCDAHGVESDQKAAAR